MLTRIVLQGVPLARRGDERLHAAYCSSPVHLEAKTLHLHFRESADSEVTIWHEGWVFSQYSRIALIGSRLLSYSY